MPELHAIPAFNDNYIWALAEHDGACLLVDPGQAEPVLEALSDGLRPQAIFLTHHHADHIGGAQQIAEHCKIPIYAPKDPRINFATRIIGDGDYVELGFSERRFRVASIPGHTSSHIAFYDQEYLFCGDTLFSMGCGRIFEGTPEQMLGSLHTLAALPDHLQLCCGHEYTLANGRFAQAAEPNNPQRDRRLAEVHDLRSQNRPSLPCTLATEKATNPFLRCQLPPVQMQVAKATGGEVADEISCFALMRSWKDGFNPAL